MNKIEIHNFGPIKDAIIDIKPMLVLIGPQASGKSTIAKLIYFFETIPDELFDNYLQSEETDIHLKRYLSDIIKKKFIKSFGLKRNFSIFFTFCENSYINITENNGNLKVIFSESCFEERKDGLILASYKTTFLNISKNNLSSGIEQQKYLNNIFQETKNLFENKHEDSLFVIAGRNATVGYSHTFEDVFKQTLLQRRRPEEQTGDEILLLGFMRRILQMKDIFLKYNGFEGILSTINNNVRPLLELANNYIINILRGKYQINNNGEFIVHNNTISISLNEASSGQQEAIRILQDAFLSIFLGNTSFRIVEEPEAHLFPEAQKATIELLTLALNNKKDNNLIITTHSPYTLTVINNLIYAAKVGKNKNEKVKELIPEALWLPTERVAAYILKDGTAGNIIDKDLGEIDPSAIDNVSKIINQQYEQITDIEYEK